MLVFLRQTSIIYLVLRMREKKMNSLVLQTDFGKQDGAVCAMYGVAQTVDPALPVFDLTHEIQPYDIWEGSYRLIQTISYWPEGTVFASVVDPGVGSTRRSIVAKTSDGKYIVTPDNGTLTHIKRLLGIEEARLIDETRNRRPDSEMSYTFHGRDVYAFTAAKLASGRISFEEVGEAVDPGTIIELPLIPAYKEGDTLVGTIDVLDIRFGSLWTNITREMFNTLDLKYGDRALISITNDTRTIYSNTMVYGHSFADVSIGESLIYVNSLDCIAVAINQGSFARAYNIGTGNSWHLTIRNIK